MNSPLSISRTGTPGCSSPSRPPSKSHVYNSPSRSRMNSVYESRLRSPSQRPIKSPAQRSLYISSPKSSPRKTPEKKVLYSDRFIPSRTSSQLDLGAGFFSERRGSFGDGAEHLKSGGNSTNNHNSVNSTNTTFSTLLRSELLGETASASSNRSDVAATDDSGSAGSGSGVGAGSDAATVPHSAPVLQYRSRRQAEGDPVSRAFALSPVSAASERLLSGPRQATRKIAKVPFKVLDAPALQDDFYLNLVDWSALNVLAVGLGSAVYLWSACTSKVTKLCDLGPNDSVTSVAWTQRGTHLCVGTAGGRVEMWDAQQCSRTRTLGGHDARVGTLACNATLLASGSRDRMILLRDARCANPVASRLAAHKQEVCGLRWSFDDRQLASGGNDNKLFIWDAAASSSAGATCSPLARFGEHRAAVKAIAWSPHQHGLLASGGGTADRCIRFWSTQTVQALNCIDTGSQVCNLMWSKNVNEIVSTHGYSLNQVLVWRYPTMTKVATLTGHTYRVLYLAMSPDGQTIATGAGDETLRFWNVFPLPKHKASSGPGSGLLFPSGGDLR